MNTRQAQMMVAAMMVASAACAVQSVRAQGLTREEVKQQTLEAIRTHAIARNDADVERLAREETYGPSRPRAQVKHETVDALARHEVPRNDEEMDHLFAVQDAQGEALSRAQVKAETREAIRLGLIPHGEGDVVATPAQIASVHAAGERAAATAYAAAGHRR